MITFLALLQAFSCGLISLALIGAVLSSQVHDGVIIKVGLICMSTGFGALALRMVSLEFPLDIPGVIRSLTLITSGIAVFIIGYLLRKAKYPREHLTDWGDL